MLAAGTIEIIYAGRYQAGTIEIVQREPEEKSGQISLEFSQLDHMNWQAVNYSLCARAVLLHGLSFLTCCRSSQAGSCCSSQAQIIFAISKDRAHSLCTRMCSADLGFRGRGSVRSLKDDEEVYVESV